MSKEEYLNTLLAQIRDRRAKELVRAEIAAHLEDQEAFYLDYGCEEEEAQLRAVRQMGDPVAVGEALDQIHRPKMSWSPIACATVSWGWGRCF